MRARTRRSFVTRTAKFSNPHPANIRTNPEKGTFPSRRAAVTIDNCDDFHIVNMTLETTVYGQAEGLLINGDRNILSHVTVIGSGDASGKMAVFIWSTVRSMEPATAFSAAAHSSANAARIESAGVLDVAT